ncbi:P-loop containing nucleoside triphosphate hydrolase protein [Chytridium lagenaria]|nr:P-loop containing nucleoside triphosphate hydrolase protein [Chytridium lagenaria]
MRLLRLLHPSKTLTHTPRLFFTPHIHLTLSASLTTVSLPNTKTLATNSPRSPQQPHRPWTSVSWPSWRMMGMWKDDKRETKGLRADAEESNLEVSIEKSGEVERKGSLGLLNDVVDAVSPDIGLLVTNLSTNSTTTLTSLNEPAMKLLTMFALQGLLTCIDIHLVTVLGERVAVRLRGRLYESILGQDMAFFDGRMQGEVVGRLAQDVGEFKVCLRVFFGLRCLAQILGTLYQLTRLSPRLTGLLLATMPVLYVAMNMYGSFLRRVSRIAREGEARAAGVAGEAVSNVRTVRAFAGEGGRLRGILGWRRRRGWGIGSWDFILECFKVRLTTMSIGGMILMVLYYGGSLVVKGEMTGGQLMTYMVSTQSAQRSLSQIGVLFGQVIKALGSAARVIEYIDHKASIPVDVGIRPAKMNGFIEFKDVSFTYPTRPGHPVLQDFSLTLPVGKVVALCGPSGSGKSTVGQLIERFYDTDRGAILIDNYDIRQLNPSWIRENVGYINQEPVLFATSILENIRYGRPDASLEEVEEAARKANAAEFIGKFPQGYGTLVGERGVTLSGGQKQRIAIARAILKDPKVLILDEATSALDTQSERIVQDALEKLMKGRTVLVIAHRLSTIQAADLIVVMSGALRAGNILETGKHDELIRKRGAYWRLYNRLSEEENERRGWLRGG